MSREAIQHAVELEQCALFVDSRPLAKAMTDAAAFLRARATMPAGNLYRQVPDEREASGVRYELVDLVGFEEHDALIEKAAVAAEAVDRIGREWVGDSLWANILKRAGDNVRKLKRGGGDGGA